jgi:hypothetical protein
MANIFQYFGAEMNIGSADGAIRAIMVHAKRMQELVEKEHLALADLSVAEDKHLAEVLSKDLSEIEKESQQFLNEWNKLITYTIQLGRIQIVDMKKLDEHHNKLEAMHAPKALSNQISEIEKKNLQTYRNILANLRAMSGLQRS